MKLYYFPGACSLTSHIVLEWVGQPYELQQVSLHPTSPELLAANPCGTVPALDIGGKVLSQNVAILNYLAEKFPQAQLCGDGSLETRTDINFWLGFINSDLHPLFAPLFGSTQYLQDETAIAKSKTVALEKIQAKLAFVEQALSGKSFLTGQRSVADAYLFNVLLWVGMMQIDIADKPNLQAFQARMQQDPAIIKVLKAEGLQ
jgi:glutathione S-transferase